MRTLLRVSGNTNALLRAATSQGQYGLNKVKASVFRRWPVTAPYRGEQTTRLTGGHDYIFNNFSIAAIFVQTINILLASFNSSGVA